VLLAKADVADQSRNDKQLPTTNAPTVIDGWGFFRLLNFDSVMARAICFGTNKLRKKRKDTEEISASVPFRVFRRQKIIAALPSCKRDEFASD
tara:strand:- start:62841 stop:63119 length:279 start_codon:yes stop_codon:yes gene_type:complete